MRESNKEKFDPSEIRVVADRVEEDPATSALVTLMERQADDEILGRSITLRWGKKQIDVVRRAAEILGVPYQTYLKQVVFKQALEDIARAEEVLGEGKADPAASAKASRDEKSAAGRALTSRPSKSARKPPAKARTS